MNERINPTGSERLPVDQKIQRIKELAGISASIKQSQASTRSNIEFLKEAPDGETLFAIIRENHDYYIKMGQKPLSGNVITESDFSYIGGEANRKKTKYESYARALKDMNILFEELNQTYGITAGENLFESDAKKYVINAPAPQAPQVKYNPAPMPAQAAPAPAPQAAPAPAGAEEAPEPSMGGDEDMEGDENFGFGDEDDMEEPQPEGEEMGGEEMPEDDMGNLDPEAKRILQKLTGKLGQKVRENREEIGPKMIKYILNSMISAFDMSKLGEEDKESIIAKINPEMEDDGMSGMENNTAPAEDASIEPEGGEPAPQGGPATNPRPSDQDTFAESRKPKGIMLETKRFYDTLNKLNKHTW